MDAMIGNLREVDIKRLRIFMTIVESGGFIQAQNELNISASTISVRMAELEHSLGLRLCHRGRSGFSMTPEGKEVYRACQSLLLAHENFISSIGAVKGEISGELRLGIIDNAIFDPNLPVSQAISNFYELATDIEISLYTMTPSELERAVLEQRLQLGIGVFYHRSPGLKYYPICNERLILYCGREHPLYDVNEEELTIDNLVDAGYIERTYGQTTSRLNQPIEFQPAAFSSSLEATALLIQTGKFIGFLPDYYAHQWCERALLKPLKAKQVYIESEVSAIVHKNQQNEIITRELLDSLTDLVDQSPVNSRRPPPSRP